MDPLVTKQVARTQEIVPYRVIEFLARQRTEIRGPDGHVLERGRPFSGNYNSSSYRPTGQHSSHREQAALDRQLELRGAAEMPFECMPPSFHTFLDNGQVHKNWRWLYDPDLKSPLMVSSPLAMQAAPRGVAILMHGSGTINSTVGTLASLGAAMVKAGFHVVMPSKPCHGGFGPHGDEHYSLAHRMNWLNQVVQLSGEYFITGKTQHLPRIMVGRSTGAKEALQYAKEFPNGVELVYAMSPYHPRWNDADCGATILMDENQVYGYAKKVPEALDWAYELDKQWTVLPKDFPAFPDQSPASQLTREQIRDMLANAAQHAAHLSDADRGIAIRAGVMEFARSRLPEGWRDDQILVGAQLLIGMEPRRAYETMRVSMESFLAQHRGKIVIYSGATDHEYCGANRLHPLVWLRAIHGNHNVQLVVATHGDHDMTRRGAAQSKALLDDLIARAKAVCPQNGEVLTIKTDRASRVLLAFLIKEHPELASDVRDACDADLLSEVDALVDAKNLCDTMVGTDARNHGLTPRSMVGVVKKHMFAGMGLRDSDPRWQAFYAFAKNKGLDVSHIDSAPESSRSDLHLARIFAQMDVGMLFRCARHVNREAVDLLIEKNPKLQEWFSIVQAEEAFDFTLRVASGDDS